MKQNPILSVSFATLCSRALGFLRNVLLAAALGTAFYADVFNAANQLPNSIFNLVAGGVLGSIFVPRLVEDLKQSESNWATTTTKLLLAVGAVGTVIVGLLIATGPWVASSFGFGIIGDAENSFASSIIAICAPQVFLYCLYAVAGQALNATKSFGPMAWAPFLNNLIFCIVLVLFLLEIGSASPVDSYSQDRLVLLAVASTVSVFVQSAVTAGFLIPVLCRSRRRGAEYKEEAEHAPRRSVLRSEMPRLKWGLLQMSFSQIAHLVVLACTASAASSTALGAEANVGLASYNYAYLAILMPHAILAAPVATVLLPKLTGLRANSPLFSTELVAGWRATVWSIVPVAIMLTALGPLLGVAGFGYGETSRVDAWFIGLTLSALALGLPSYASRSTLMYGLFASGETRIPSLGVVAGSTVQIVVAVVASWVLDGTIWAVPVIALGFAASNIIIVCVLKRRLRREHGRLVIALPSREILRSVTSGFAGTVFTYGGYILIEVTSILDGFTIAEVSIALCVGVAATYIVSRLLGVDILRVVRTRSSQ